MLALPLLDFPYGHYVMSATWHMLNGRSGDQHHLFPVPAPEGPDARQGPMLPADYYKTETLDVDLQIAVGMHSFRHVSQDHLTTFLHGALTQSVSKASELT